MTDHPIEPARPFIGAHLIVIRNRQILLLKRETGNLHGKYMFPAGKVDRGEAPSRTLVREAAEEIGITIDPSHLSPVSVIYRTDTLYNDNPIDIVEIFMSVSDWQGEPQNLEPQLCSEIGFYSLDQLPDNLSPSVQHLIDNLEHNFIEVESENWNGYTAKSFAVSREVFFTKSK